MSGETEEQPSGWTSDLLKQHYDRLASERDLRYEQRFVAQQEAIHAALQAAKEAVGKAEASVESRLQLLNELRSGVATTDQLNALDKVIDDVKARLDRIEGRSVGLGAGWTYLVGAVGLAGAVIGIIVGTR